jgi:uncharacterized protein YbgA (DUF1722 family)/uncharacterized protein YbbK (DUF523 family)
MTKPSLPIRVGISTCLLGEKVRFDAGHKKDRYLTDILGSYFEWVPVCPEVEVGMGVPREAVRLLGTAEAPRMVGTKSEEDWTERMTSYGDRRVRSLAEHELSGYILKSDSPSCGMERVRIYGRTGIPVKNGRGLFAAQLMRAYPLLPVEEEGRLNDAKLRENFIVRVFAYHRFVELTRAKWTIGELVAFHTIHKYLLLAHSPKHYELLGRLVASSAKAQRAALEESYGRLFMEALSLKTTTKKNVNVLQHILGFLKDNLSAREKEDILSVIDEYHRELVPLIVPLTLLRHYVKKHDVRYIAEQVYLHPHPKELMLRNHV